MSDAVQCSRLDFLKLPGVKYKHNILIGHDRDGYKCTWIYIHPIFYPFDHEEMVFFICIN